MGTRRKRLSVELDIKRSVLFALSLGEGRGFRNLTETSSLRIFLHQGEADKRHAFSSNIAYADSDVAAKTVLQLKLVIGLLYREKRI